VILRLRSVVDTVSRDYHGARVLVVCHQVIVLCMRYLLERMTEEEVLAVDRAAEVANCSVTAYAYDPAVGQDGSLVLTAYNFVAPIEREGAPVTSAPDAPVAAK
jgi:broad specificity phosphatase PhoE